MVVLARRPRVLSVVGGIRCPWWSHARTGVQCRRGIKAYAFLSARCTCTAAFPSCCDMPRGSQCCTRRRRSAPCVHVRGSLCRPIKCRSPVVVDHPCRRFSTNPSGRPSGRGASVSTDSPAPRRCANSGLLCKSRLIWRRLRTPGQRTRRAGSGTAHLFRPSSAAFTQSCS